MDELESANPADVYERYLSRSIAGPFTRVLLGHAARKRSKRLLTGRCAGCGGWRREKKFVEFERTSAGKQLPLEVGGHADKERIAHDAHHRLRLLPDKECNEEHKSWQSGRA